MPPASSSDVAAASGSFCVPGAGVQDAIAKPPSNGCARTGKIESTSAGPFAAFASILRACARDHQSGGIAWWPPATLGFALMLALSDTALAYIADRRHGIAAERARTVT